MPPHKHGEAPRHGKPATKEYNAWVDMKRRCYNPKPKDAVYWQDRGIVVCDAWRDNYLAFLTHVGRAPEGKILIDRIDNDRGYEPGNVRWATTVQSKLNQRKRRTGYRRTYDPMKHFRDPVTKVFVKAFA